MIALRLKKGTTYMSDYEKRKHRMFVSVFFVSRLLLSWEYSPSALKRGDETRQGTRCSVSILIYTPHMMSSTELCQRSRCSLRDKGTVADRRTPSITSCVVPLQFDQSMKVTVYKAYVGSRMVADLDVKG